MSYTIFALKWRPKDFDEIIGQPHIVSTLKSSIQKGRLANAYLFAGPRGVGKTSTARIFAKALNCKEGPTINPCNKCACCAEIAQGSSFDVIEIDGASNTGVDNIRALRESVKFTPASGRFKIYIIDEVHMLSDSAFNALLKTLEEPPPYVKFVFATTHPHEIIPTILSRCQRFDFRRITVMEIVTQLERIVKAEKLEVDKEVLVAIARSSDGSLRDAESVLDQLTSFAREKISLNDVISVLGLIEQEVLFAITDKIIQKDPKGALELLNKIIDEGKDISVFLLNLIEHFRNLMVAKITKADAKLIDLPQEICEGLLRQSQALSLEEIFSAFNILVNAQEMSKRLDSLRIPLEISLVRLAHDRTGTAHKATTAAPPLKTADAGRKTIQQQATADKQQDEQPSGEGHRNLINLEDIKDAWKNIIETLAQVKMSVATYLHEGSPIKIENNVLTISFPKNYSLHKESLERKENRAIIEKTASGLLSANLKINFILSKETANNNGSADHPIVRSALEAFGGKIIKEI